MNSQIKDCTSPDMQGGSSTPARQLKRHRSHTDVLQMGKEKAWVFQQRMSKVPINLPIVARQSNIARKDKPPQPEQHRRRAVPVSRRLIKVDKWGNQSNVVLNKQQMELLGVQQRDMRILDPSFSSSYPAAILHRDQALVLNIEEYKAIVTTEYLLVHESSDIKKFKGSVLSILKERLFYGQFPILGFMMQKRTGTGVVDQVQNGSDAQKDLIEESQEAIAEIPFELRVLEVILEAVCSDFDKLGTELEQKLYPTLDKLVSTVSSRTLEVVRRLKLSLVRLKTKVETIKEVLEKLIDDDQDMSNMNLTHKQERIAKEQAEQHLENLKKHSSGSSSSSSSSSSSKESDEGGDEVEQLLESYYMQMDHVYNRVSNMYEYIGDTEDLINIELDGHRNQLIQVDLVFTVCSFAVSIVAMVGSIFGMNLAIPRMVQSTTSFTTVSIVTVLFAMLVIIAFLLYAYHKGLIGMGVQRQNRDAWRLVRSLGPGREEGGGIGGGGGLGAGGGGRMGDSPRAGGGRGKGGGGLEKVVEMTSGFTSVGGAGGGEEGQGVDGGDGRGMYGERNGPSSTNDSDVLIDIGDMQHEHEHEHEHTMHDMHPRHDIHGRHSMQTVHVDHLRHGTLLRRSTEMMGGEHAGGLRNSYGARSCDGIVEGQANGVEDFIDLPV